MPKELYAFYTCVKLASSSINPWPWIYGFMNTTFRNEYRKLFKLHVCSRDRTQPNTTLAEDPQCPISDSTGQRNRFSIKTSQF